MGKGTVWIVSELAAAARNVPQGALSGRLRMSSESLWEDAAAVVRAGVEALKRKFPRDEIVPPQSGMADEGDSEQDS